ncbi:hypothetical protein BJX63DRAFT_437579 [Aspergillus granulosus]|uniref:Uncharacterized protein n=1 Tax=Aspergillus granulosus TaxID=176169 RepID=A0ABR4GUK4_9EURO
MSNSVHPEGLAGESGLTDNQHFDDYYEVCRPTGATNSTKPSSIRHLQHQINRTRKLAVSRQQQYVATAEKNRYEAELAGVRMELDLLRARLEAAEKNVKTWRENYRTVNSELKELTAKHCVGTPVEEKHAEQPHGEDYWHTEYNKQKAETAAWESKSEALERRVKHLELEQIRTLTANQPAAIAVAEKMWQPKYEAMEQELVALRQQANDSTRELQRQKEVQEERQNHWQSLQVQFQDDLDRKDATIGALEQKYLAAQRDLKLAQDTLNGDKDSISVKYYRLKLDTQKEVRELEYQVQESQLAVKLLEMRLMEEEDTNWMWKYKYVGGF